MPLDAAAILHAPRHALASLTPEWRRGLAGLGLGWALLIGLFHADWAAMAGQWWNSSTYNHVLFVPPIVAWLVSLRAPALVRIAPSGWWPGLVALGGAALLWVLGTMAGLATAAQAGVVAMAIATVLTMLGPRVAAGLAFPLAYLLFLVPVGDEFVPLLQMVTAHITIALVHLSGIPAQIDGVFIDTPAGLFEVAEACSGVKFLIAMIAFGALVANVCFLDWRRRAAFLLACVVVPILANGLRAWGTIQAAQFVGVEVAAGIDHIVYGWFFFAFVLFALLAIGWRYFDRAIDDPMIDVARLSASPRLARLEALRLGPLAALPGALAIVLAAQGWAHAANGIEAPAPARIDLAEVPGWHRVDHAPRVAWEPRAAGADHRLLGSYADARGHRVDVFYALYAGQGEGREAGAFGEGALGSGTAWSWLAPAAAPDGGMGERLLAQGNVERLAWTWYRHGAVLTGSNARLKLATLNSRLLLHARPTAMLILSAEEGQGAPAATILADFRAALGPPDIWMDRTGGLR